MCLDDTKGQNIFPGLKGLGNKICIQLQSEIICDTYVTGQLVEMLIYVLFSPISQLLLEVPETSLLSCLREGSVEERESCRPCTGQSCLRTKVIAGGDYT